MLLKEAGGTTFLYKFPLLILTTLLRAGAGKDVGAEEFTSVIRAGAGGEIRLCAGC